VDRGGLAGLHLWCFPLFLRISTPLSFSYWNNFILFKKNISMTWQVVCANFAAPIGREKLGEHHAIHATDPA
jgi:hypothetical protein